MLFIPSILDLDPDLCSGTWTLEQLLAMDAAFTGAVEAAFSAGLESRSAAAATVRIGRNGKEAAIEGAIEAGWQELCRRQGEAAFSEIVQFVRARLPGIDSMRVRVGFEQRFRQHGRAPWMSDAAE